jgi:ribosomal protein L36
MKEFDKFTSGTKGNTGIYPSTSSSPIRQRRIDDHALDDKTVPQFDIRRMPLEKISIKGTRRTCDEMKVADLAESMREIGLKTPITVQLVDDVPVFVAGFHRLQAAKHLQWPEIDCILFHGDQVDARLWELTENLFRADLRVLEQAESLDEWIRLVDEKTKDGQVAHPGGRQPHDKGVSRAARELNLHRENVRRAETIANICPDAKSKARQQGLDDNQSALLTIAKEPTPEAQITKVDEIATRKRIRRSDKASSEQTSAAVGQELTGRVVPTQSTDAYPDVDQPIGPDEAVAIMKEFAKFIMARIRRQGKIMVITVTEEDVHEFDCLLGRAKLAI